MNTFDPGQMALEAAAPARGAAEPRKQTTMRVEYGMTHMRLHALVNVYHIDTDLTCAEAMFNACNEYYHLNLSEESRKLFSLMGVGMQTECSCCGAFTVAVGIIGLLTAQKDKTNVHNTEGSELVYELTSYMIDTFGTLQCNGLSRLRLGESGTNPCHIIVQALAKKLEKLLAARQTASSVQ
ncbi:MAG TPA: C-GCAxxG-C-C family protein [Candidatus Treponema faecavium]|nr:C-GCAxxG-C-C family protein [Candidatus Treponema faecavium]